MDGATLSIDYSENLGVARMGEVVFTTNGGTGGPATFTLIIEQSGALPTITVVPDSYPDVLASPAGTLMPNITLGGGAESWSVVAGTNPDGFLTFSSPTTVTGDGTLSIDYAENAGVARMGEVVFTTTGGMDPAATFTLIIEQAGAGPTIDVSPASFSSVAASPEGTLMPTITLGGGAEGWSAVAITNPGNFLTFSSPTTVTGSGTLSIDYAENAGGARMGEVEFTTSGGTGPAATFTLNIVQGELHVLTIGTKPANTTDLPFRKGKVIAVLTLSGDATGWNAIKTGDENNLFIPNFTSSGTINDRILAIEYAANNAAENTRMATITVSTIGGTGTIDTQEIVLSQRSDILAVRERKTPLNLYPNPTSQSFYIENEAENAHISIQHLHGGQAMRIEAQRGRNLVDIGHLAEGVYIVTLSTEQGNTSARLLKRPLGAPLGF